jgi:hypothetical protein
MRERKIMSNHGWTLMEIPSPGLRPPSSHPMGRGTGRGASVFIRVHPWLKNQQKENYENKTINNKTTINQ